MHRISSLSQQVTKKTSLPTVTSSLDWFGVDELMGKEAIAIKNHLRPVLERGVVQQMIPYINNAEFPEALIDVFKAHKIGHYFFTGKHGNKSTPFESNTIIMETARADASLAVLLLVQLKLLGRTIELYGSEAQKDHYIPLIKEFDFIGGWGLTELDNGSDASAIQTTVKFENGNYILNGNKRWIGNANKDIMIVFARNVDSKQIEAFIVHLDQEGVTRSMIQNKLALRPVQNGQIFYQNVKIPANRKLPGVKGFASVAKLLAESRMAVSWMAVGVGIGVYDNMMKYVSKREQFGRKTTSFQLMQDKIVRVMSLVQSSLLLCWQAQSLVNEGKASIGKLAFTKAIVSKYIREAAAIGREALGGNGILLENHLIKAVVDMEAVYTFEGTYDINTLVTGRELTGIAAFKAR